MYVAQATVVRTTEFLQGKQTRWGLAWSFTAQAATTVQQPSVASITPAVAKPPTLTPRTKLSFNYQTPDVRAFVQQITDFTEQYEAQRWKQQFLQQQPFHLKVRAHCIALPTVTIAAVLGLTACASAVYVLFLQGFFYDTLASPSTPASAPTTVIQHSPLFEYELNIFAIRPGHYMIETQWRSPSASTLQKYFDAPQRKAPDRTLSTQCFTQFVTALKELFT